MEQTSRLSIVVDTGNADKSLQNLHHSLADLDNSGEKAGSGMQKIGSGMQKIGNKAKEMSAKVANAVKKIGSGMQKIGKNMQKIGAVSSVGLAAVGLAIKDVTSKAVEFEFAMAGVKKVIDFDSPAAFRQMEKDILAMSTRLPMTADGLADIMASAGQAGIATEQLARFTEMAAKMGIAFDISADEAGQAMAQMRVAFSITQDEVETLADKINYLGNTTPNAADKILDVVQRIGSLGGIAGVSADQIAALAGSITAVAPEVVATGLKNVMLALTRGESATKSHKKAMDSLGLSVATVAKNMQIDSMGTFIDVIERIKGLPKELQVSKINDIFGSEALPVISQLVENADLLKTNLQAVGDASKYAGSMLQEFESMAGTTKAQMQLFENNITAVKIALGDALLPTINKVMQALTPAMQAFATWAGEHPKIVATVAIVTTAMLSLGVAVGAVGLAVASAVAGFGLLAGVSAPIWGVVAAVVAVGTALVALALHWNEFNDALGEILYYMVEDVKEKWQAISDAIGGTIYEIVQNAKQAWDKLKAALTVIGYVIGAQLNLVKNIFATAFNVIKTLIRDAMDRIKQAIYNGMQKAWGVIKTGVGDIIQVFLGLGSTLTRAGQDAIQGFINGVRKKIREAITIAADMANSVARSVRSALDIRSPSRVMRQLGAYAGEGFVLGVGDKVKDAKQVAKELAGSLTNTLQDLHRQNFMLTNTNNPLADFEYKLQFGELAGLQNNQKQRLLQLAQINLDIQRANEAISLAMKEQERSAQNIAAESDRSKSRYNDLQKQVALWGNQSKLVEFDYDWKNGAFDGADNMLLLRERNAIAMLEKLQHQDKTKNAFELLQGDLAGESDPLSRLKKELDDRLAIIKDYENAHTDVEHKAAQAREQTAMAYLHAKNNLMLTTYEQGLGAVAGIIKSAFGEQSKIYRAMFAMEKGMAAARVLLQNKVALANAWASAPFPQNLPIIAKTAIQTGALSGAINAITPIIGQAHDGIMSVPKSGTWNLERGERVLPKHTAKNLDNTLNRLQANGGTGVVINQHITINADGRHDVKDDSHNQIGQTLKTGMLALIQGEMRQGRSIYNFVKNTR